MSDPSSSWTFGGGEILQTAHNKHLGVVQTQLLCQPGDISALLGILRGTFLSLATCGLNMYGINPISAMKLYTSIVLLKALYSCELWNNINTTAMSQLEITHRFCIQFCQGLLKLTRTDVALDLVGISPIDKRLIHIDFQIQEIFPEGVANPINECAAQVCLSDVQVSREIFPVSMWINLYIIFFFTEHFKIISICFEVLRGLCWSTATMNYAKGYMKIDFFWPPFCFEMDKVTSYWPLNRLWKRDPAFYCYRNRLSSYWSRQF